MHAKACVASRGHVSRSPSTGLYISELASICHGIHRQAGDMLNPYHSS